MPAIRSLSLVWALGTPSLASQLLQRMFVACDFRRSRLAGDQVLEPCMGLGDAIAGKPAPTEGVSSHAIFVGAGLPAIRSLNLVWALGTPSLASQLLQRMFVARDFCRSRLAGDQVL
ncbi:hypothetical protein DOZ80_17345 [Pseudomonas fluorescens]|uniref:Uncharacterized protein n=1 Tax=Pseudomonas fluorescens TaxID=294 RepID=A0A327MZ24_PSEFL|nr:hypothetical protein DOZ80_17345 [Pseudomonas fluorescens]